MVVLWSRSLADIIDARWFHSRHVEIVYSAILTYLSYDSITFNTKLSNELILKEEYKSWIFLLDKKKPWNWVLYFVNIFATTTDGLKSNENTKKKKNK